jgi:pantoate--beta-alanine ligase
VRIEGGRTIREKDGLAMSSRNAYLTADERARAPMLYRTLCAVAEDVAAGANEDDRAAAGIADLTKAGFGPVDYLVVRDAETLQPWTDRSRPGRALTAARLGRARLIDNVPVFAR